MKRLEGKVAVVTGGALGIGKATCIALANEEAKVAITNILDEEGKKVEEIIISGGHTARYWNLDVSITENVQKLYSEIKQEYGKIDVLVNNAGISGANKPTDEITEEEWEKVMTINVFFNGI